MTTRTRKCSICGNRYDAGCSNNAYPYKGRCCNRCNDEHVIPERRRMFSAYLSSPVERRAAFQLRNAGEGLRETADILATFPPAATEEVFVAIEAANRAVWMAKNAANAAAIAAREAAPPPVVAAGG
jgi:hypothetical protein